MKVLDLFSGIGGFSLGLERAGMQTVAFCEIDPWCRKILAKHWPGVPIYEDIRGIMADTESQQNRWGIEPRLEPDTGTSGYVTDGTTQVGAVDVICGGFPCQDISVAGKGAGIKGERSGLWSEFARLIGEIRPRFAIIENVAALLHRGLCDVLGDLAALGYDAEWHCIPAAAVGAPHRRDRVWIIAYPVQHTDADTLSSAQQERQYQGAKDDSRICQDVADPGRLAPQVPLAGQLAAIQESYGRPWWAVEPDVDRVAHGVPGRMDRLRGLGNAVVPQIPELIGRAILETAD